MLVASSPKSHCHEFGFPSVVSANITVCPTIGDVGLYTKDAVTGAGIMVIVFIVLLETKPFEATRLTL